MFYYAVFQKNLKQQLMYRSEFLLTILGALLFIYVQISIWQALLGAEVVGATNVIGGGGVIGLGHMVTFVIVSYLLRQASRTGFTDAFAKKINEGNISVDLIRPVGLKNVMFSEQASQNLCIIAFACVPVAVISHFVWGTSFDLHMLELLLFIASVLLAIVLCFYIEYIAGLLIFWTRDPVYTRQISGGLMLIFSGATIPLWFYPGWLAAIARFLPFRLVAFEPIQIFLGQVDVAGGLWIVLQQVLWIFAIYGLERFVWYKIQQNVFVQGG